MTNSFFKMYQKFKRMLINYIPYILFKYKEEKRVSFHMCTCENINIKYKHKKNIIIQFALNYAVE